MADRDPYGLWGTSASEDKYDVWGTGPRKKRVRSKRPASRNVEQPSIPAAEEEEDAPADRYALRPEPAPEPVPPSAAPAAPRAGEMRTEEPAWYEPLLKSGASALQGMTFNTADEVGAAAQWATDKMGLTDYGGTFDEKLARARKGMDRATAEYPAAHTAGAVTSGMLASAAAPATKLAQGAIGATTSALSEYGESGDPWRAAGAGALGAGAGVLGGALANRGANRAARDVETAFVRDAEAMGAVPRNPPKLPVAEPLPGELDMRPAQGALNPLLHAPERELRNVALKQAADKAPPDDLGQLLKATSLGQLVAGNPYTAGGQLAAGALNRLRAPSNIERAIQARTMVPNKAAGAAWAAGARGLYDATGLEDYAARGAGAVGAEVDKLVTSKANAQERVAYADQNATNYALTEVLHGGNTGLSQQDEEAITSAVVRGDDDAIRATDFRLRQRYPAYARRVERALRSLNDEEH